MSSTSKNYRQPLWVVFAQAKHLILSFAIVGVLFFATTANATFIGHDPNNPPGGSWDQTSDGLPFVIIQLDNPVTQAGTVDSFSFYEGATGSSMAAMIVRPTGNPNEYSIVYDSGIISLTAFPYDTTGVKTVSISPVAIQIGDLVAHWGQGVAYDDAPGGGLDDRVYNISKPTTTFTASGLVSFNRLYAVAFNVVEVPEPTSASIAILGMMGFCRIVRKRR